ncbi:hypothetical protein AB0G67_40465 [Streptomyces sp. NPDC021056]|uniref:hypothetical protein n=1 Tax=Streptomyces sp. NPDC021056 TaxID=3155012 RepID=UPI003409F057
MKKLIHRIRTTDRRVAAINIVLFAVFGAITWTAVRLLGVLLDSNPHNHQPSDAVPAAYVIGALGTTLLADLMRRADKALRARFVREATPAAE